VKPLLHTPSQAARALFPARRMVEPVELSTTSVGYIKRVEVDFVHAAFSVAQEAASRAPEAHLSGGQG